MESFEFINKLLDGKIVLGSKEEVCSGLFLIPVYKVKISFLNLKTDINSNNGDGASGSISVYPISLIKIYNNNINIINLDDSNKKEGILDMIPNVLNNMDFNNFIKNIKLN